MATKSLRYLDDQGRIVLPNHIRKALNLNSGNVVEVSQDDDGTIRIRPSEDRCSICGGSVEGKHHIKLKKDKPVCYECCQAIAKAMLK